MAAAGRTVALTSGHATETTIEYVLVGAVYLSKRKVVVVDGVVVGGGIQLRRGGGDGELLCRDYQREIHQN